MLGILGKKMKMSQVFTDNGDCVPITCINAGPCFVIQVKNKEKDGYQAIQLGFEDKKEKRMTKALLGHFKKSGVSGKKIVKELLVVSGKYEVGQKLEVGMFKKGDFVDVTGQSIGKGFQGGMKRWGWSGGPKTHGSMHHRRPGSIGATTTPGRVLRGHHLPGHMGNRKVTIQNLKVIQVDRENNILLVKGAVPGHKGSYLMIRKAKKK
ncbi:MAG: 50S ribosomal protein L3 [Candidatus Omnitrophota bacterium]|nr:MAG: 50S ribosomal protein L3 [Candidatus Omnitrophota bacterium]